MTKRLLLSYLTVTLVVLLLLELPLALFYSQRELERLTSDIERDATVLATIYEDDLEGGLRLDAEAADRYHDRTGARVVVVDASGVGLIDTQQPVPRDFSTRPEIAAALTGERASGTRRSDTLGTDLVYVAVPVASSGTVHGALRLTLDASSVDSRIHRFWLGLGATGVLVLAVMALVGWLIARSVTWPLRRLTATAERFANGDLSIEPSSPGGPKELRVLADTMSDMAERLTSTIDEQRAFVADASHQLRTPLTALRLRLENLQTRLDDADADELDLAIEETSRLSGLVTDLLQLARADERRAVAIVDVAQLAVDRVDTWSALADARSIDLRWSGEPSPVYASALPGAVEQILDNLIDNAVNASDDGSTIDVSLTLRGMRAVLAVADHGPGLSVGDRVRATRRFWRGTTLTPGSGLGLSIASTLAVASGGHLELSDTPGGGLTATLDLPIAAR